MQKPLLSDFKKILINNANLGWEGMLTDAYCKQFNIDLARSRKELLDAFAHFQVCCEWLAECQVTKKATASSPPSYVLKHMVEIQYDTPVANGALIAAVIHLQFPIMPDRDAPNVRVGLSKRSLSYITNRGAF